ncbi:MAG: WG repeat-containing protein [Flavobacteriia bacterium]|nr:WG repeat-containing protein [Flavobacteriia bacterium]
MKYIHLFILTLLSISLYAQAPLPMNNGDSWGYLNYEGQWICEPKFEQVSFFENGYAAAKRDGKWVMIDENFQEVSREFPNARIYGNGTEPFPLRLAFFTDGNTAYVPTGLNEFNEVPVPVKLKTYRYGSMRFYYGIEVNRFEYGDAVETYVMYDTILDPSQENYVFNPSGQLVEVPTSLPYYLAEIDADSYLLTPNDFLDREPYLILSMNGEVKADLKENLAALHEVIQACDPLNNSHVMIETDRHRYAYSGNGELIYTDNPNAQTVKSTTYYRVSAGGQECYVTFDQGLICAPDNGLIYLLGETLLSVGPNFENAQLIAIEGDNRSIDFSSSLSGLITNQEDYDRARQLFGTSSADGDYIPLLSKTSDENEVVYLDNYGNTTTGVMRPSREQRIQKVVNTPAFKTAFPGLSNSTIDGYYDLKEFTWIEYMPNQWSIIWHELVVLDRIDEDQVGYYATSFTYHEIFHPSRPNSLIFEQTASEDRVPLAAYSTPENVLVGQLHGSPLYLMPDGRILTNDGEL